MRIRRIFGLFDRSRGRLIILDHGLVIWLGQFGNNAEPKDEVTCFERFMDVEGRVKKDFVLCVVMLMFDRGTKIEESVLT